MKRKLKFSILWALLASFLCGMIGFSAETRYHPYDNSMSESSMQPQKYFGYKFSEIEGDFRATFGESGRTETRDAILAYTQLSTVGAKTGSVKPSSLILQPLLNSNGTPKEDLQDKTGYLAYFVGDDGNSAQLISNMNQMIDKYAPFFNGNAQYLKDRILPKTESTAFYDDMPTNDYPELGSPGYGTKDMFIKVEGKLFFNISFLHLLSGAGNSVALVDTVPERQSGESNESYYSQKMKSWQLMTTPWPQIKNLTVQENGDVTYTAEIYGENGTSGRVDLMANFQDNKVKLPSAELDSLSEYWRKMKFAYYYNLIATQNSPDPFRNYMLELDAIPYSNQSVQTVTKTIPAEEVLSIIDSSRTDNKITLYVTDMFGRYIAQTIDYQITALNLKASDIWYSPNPVNPNDQVTVSALITNESSEIMETEVVVRKDGVELGKNEMTVGAGQAIRTTGYSFTASNAASVNIEFEVNPSKNKPMNETNWVDNKTNRVIPIAKPNLKLSDIWYSPDPVKPTNKVTTSVLVSNEGAQPITSELVAKVDGTQIGKQSITIGANSSVRSTGFKFTAPDKPSVNVEFEVNPTRTMPNNETTFTDNKDSRTIPIQQDLNLFILLRDVPPKVNSNENFTFKVVVGNESSVPLTTEVVVRDDYKYSVEVCVDTDDEGNCIDWEWVTENRQKTDTRTVTVPAKDEIIYTLTMPAGWDYYDIGVNEYYLTLTANVNQSRSIMETTYTDNSKVKKVYVNPFVIPKKRGVLIK